MRFTEILRKAVESEIARLMLFHGFKNTVLPPVAAQFACHVMTRLQHDRKRRRKETSPMVMVPAFWTAHKRIIPYPDASFSHKLQEREIGFLSDTAGHIVRNHKICIGEVLLVQIDVQARNAFRLFP